MSKSWKNVERKIAKSLNTERVPLSGGNSKISKGDVIHDQLYIEVKTRKSMAIMVLWRTTLGLARAEGKIPILAIKEKGKHGELAIIDWKMFVELWENYQKCHQ